MQVVLTPELERIVRERIESGRYPTPGDVIAAGLRLLRDEDTLRQAKYIRLQRDVQAGIEALDQGRFTTHNQDSLFELIETIKSEGRAFRSESEVGSG